MTNPLPALGICALIALSLLWLAIKRTRQSIDDECSDKPAGDWPHVPQDRSRGVLRGHGERN